MARTNVHSSERGDQTRATAVTVWNDSGGVGKTTVTINVAEALAGDGNDVLVIDLDPQYGGLTDHSGYDAALKHPEYNIVDVMLMPNRSLADIVIPGDEDNGLSWDLIPAHEDLGSFGEMLGSNLPPGEQAMLQLRKNMETAGLYTEYDYILIDCQATRGKLVANAVTAALNVIIPTEFSRKGSRSVDGLVDFVTGVQRDLRRIDGIADDVVTDVVAIVPNNAAKTGQLTNNEKQSLEYLLAEYPAMMPAFYIPSRTALQDAWTAQKPLVEYVESSDTRSLRANEKVLPEMFDVLAEMVVAGGAQHVDDSAVANIPTSCYPETQQNVATPTGDA